MKHVVALIVALLLNAIANLLMKVGARGVHQSGGFLAGGIGSAASAFLAHPVLIIGLICFGLNAVFYMYALQSPALKISLAYPIMVGGGYALIAVVAHWHPALNESLTWGQKIGIVAVLAGIVLIAVSSEPGEAPPVAS